MLLILRMYRYWFEDNGFRESGATKGKKIKIKNAKLWASRESYEKVKSLPFFLDIFAGGPTRGALVQTWAPGLVDSFISDRFATTRKNTCTCEANQNIGGTKLTGTTTTVTRTLQAIAQEPFTSPAYHSTERECLKVGIVRYCKKPSRADVLAPRSLILSEWKILVLEKICGVFWCSAHSSSLRPEPCLGGSNTTWPTP